MRNTCTIFAVGALLLMACPQVDQDLDAGFSGTDAASGDASSADASQSTVDEQEPNNGATVDDYNHLPLDTTLQGGLQQADDVDVFSFDTVSGELYIVTLTPSPGSQL